MLPFSYRKIRALDELQHLSIGPDVRFLAGGTTLVDLMRQQIERPMRVIDINALPLAEIARARDGGVRIGALVRMSRLAADPMIVAEYPAVSQALLASASPQLRNMATIGGNLMQRTRCSYFRDPVTPCNKREPGSGCGAIEGENRRHAILGTSSHCIATHASDLAVAFAAFGAEIQIQGAKGQRLVPIGEFHRLPGDTPEIETVLESGELITAILLPPLPAARRSLYLKLRDRASYDFALVSVAAALARAPDGSVTDARLALGGVGTKPWRAVAAEAMLRGAPLTGERIRQAAEVALDGASPQTGNGFKLPLARRAIIRAFGDLGEQG
jgi:xanthine dehydrogenase YagS FAD-binding subunit